MRRTERLLQVLLGGIVAHPRLVLLLFLLGTGVLGWQVRHFRIDASADTLLMRDDPHYIQTRMVDRRFAPQEFLLVAYVPRDRPLFSTQTFDDLRSLTAGLRKLERVASVRSILNVPLFGVGGGGLDALEDPSRLTLEQRPLAPERIRQALAGHPLYENLLINREQTATALQVLFKRNPELDALDDRITRLQAKTLDGALSAEDARKLEALQRQAEPLREGLDAQRTVEIETIRRLIADYGGRADIYLGGAHVLGYQLIQIIRNDLVVFGGAIAAMIGLLLMLLFRKLRWVLITALCCGCSLLATIGLFGGLGFKVTVISANFIVLQLILTLAIVIHLIVQYRECAAAEPEASQLELVRQTLQRKVVPCFSAGFTTAIGFGSLLCSGIRPVITFGWMMIIAMAISIGVSLVLFPAVMVLFGRERAVRPWRLSRRLLDALAGLSLRRQGWVLALAGAVLAASLTGLLQLDVENSFINYFRERTRVHQELTFIDQQFGGSTPLDILYTIPGAARQRDLVMTAATVQRLQHLQYALQRHPAMGKILSVVNFTEVAKKVNDGKPLTEYELTAVYWTLEDALREELLGAFFDPDHAQVRLSLRIRDATPGLNRAELLQAIRADLRQLDIPPENYQLTGLFILYQDILRQLFRSQILTMGIVYGVLLLAFLLLFRSLRIACIGMVPNILSTLIVLGVMGWLGIALDLMTITIVAIAMGIAVDDTIHYIHRYREEVAAETPEQAVARSHTSVGYAILDTTLIIVLGFSLLTFSNFLPSVLFGLLAGFAMLAALAFDLLLLPLLLYRWGARRSKAAG